MAGNVSSGAEATNMMGMGNSVACFPGLTGFEASETEEMDYPVARGTVLTEDGASNMLEMDNFVASVPCLTWFRASETKEMGYPVAHYSTLPNLPHSQKISN